MIFRQGPFVNNFHMAHQTNTIDQPIWLSYFNAMPSSEKQRKGARNRRRDGEQIGNERGLQSVVSQIWWSVGRSAMTMNGRVQRIQTKKNWQWPKDARNISKCIQNRKIQFLFIYIHRVAESVRTPIFQIFPRFRSLL